MKRLPYLLVAILIGAGSAYAQRPAAPPIDYETAHLSRIVNAVRIDEKITIDGVLKEPAWELATPATDFIRWRPSPGSPASEKTETYFLYDADNLYVGF